MKRRRAVRLAGAGILGGLAGCLGGADGSGETPSQATAPFEHPGTLDTAFATNGEFPTDEDPGDGYPPAFPDPPAAPDVETGSFETNEVNGETVRLAPIDVVIRWYHRGEARFVDARGLDQYEVAHVYGAVLSTAQAESTGGSIPGWDTTDRVITYCGCPHHLSSIRAAGLQKAGFERVFALDEGFITWARDRGYPMAGTQWVGDAETAQAAWTVEGSVDPAHAGEYAWAIAGERYEAAPIDDEGRYAIHVGFPDVTERTRVTIRTPAYTVTRPLGELAEGSLNRV